MAIPAPEIDNRTSLLEIDKGQSFSFQPVATGNPTLWEAIGLPDGLAINSSTGRITGIPTVPGLYGVTLKASNFDKRKFTASAANDTLSVPGNSLADGDIVKVIEGASSTLPQPLTTQDNYEVREKSGSDLKLAPIVGGPALDLTTDGTGTNLEISKKQTDEITLLIPVLETGSTLTNDDITFEMNVDVVTGKVTFLGVEGAEWGPATTEKRDDGLKAPVLLVKKGDRFPVAIGFTRNGILQDLDLATLRLGSKEFVPEQLLDLTDGSFLKIGSGRSTRYKVVMVVGDNVWRGVLSNYEDDDGTYLDSHSEVQFTIVNKFGSGEINDTIVHAQQSLTGSSIRQQTFNFTGFPQDPGPVEYTLTLSLRVFGRERQNAEIVKTFDVSHNGTEFTITDTGGANTDSPATEDPLIHWDSILQFISMDAQGSNGAIVTSRVQATDQTNAVSLEIPLAGTGWYVTETTLYGPGSDPYSSYDYLDWELHETYYDYDYTYQNWWGNVVMNSGDSEATILAALNSAVDSYWGQDDLVNHVHFDPHENIIRINMEGQCPIWEMYENFTLYVGPYTRKVDYNGHAHQIAVTAKLEADAEGVDDVFVKTSETFILRVEGDLVEDSNA